MAAQDVNITNWQGIEAHITRAIAGQFDRLKNEGTKDYQSNFTSILEQHKAALIDNTEKMQNLTKAIQNLSGGIGGGGGGGAVDGRGVINAPTPKEGQTGAKPTLMHRMVRSIGLSRDDAMLSGSEDNPFFDMLTRAMAIKYGVGAAVSVGSQFMPQTIARNFYAGAQRATDRYVTGPTQLGMLAGYQGPGYENYGQQQGIGSSFGSLIAGSMAFPSMVFSGGNNPNMLGGVFGASMSPAQYEGSKTSYRAFTRSLNPFDMLSYEKALEINQGVAQKGFRNLGEQVSVEEAVTDIVMKTGVDVGNAIDALDLSIKRLKMDARETIDSMKDIGSQAKSAGKGVSDFLNESLQVTNKLNALGGYGGATARAGKIYSGFTGLEGSNVQAFLGGQGMTGILAANIMGGGVGGQFRNPKDMMKLAMGFYPAMGEGQGAEEAAIAQIESMRGLVDRVAAQNGGDKDMAMMMVAKMTGQDPYMIQQIYKEGPKVIRQSKATSKMEGLVGGWKEYYSGKGRRGKRALSDEGKTAFGRFKELAQEGATDWNFNPGNEADVWSNRAGLNFDNIDIGGMMGGNVDSEFETKVQDIYDARMRGDKDALAEAERRAEGTSAARAASLLMQAGRGKESAWKALNADYGIKFEGPGVTWDSTQGNVDKASRERYQKEAKDMLQEFQASGAITKEQRQRIQKQLMSKKGLSPEDFQTQVNEAMAGKRQRENEVKIGLSDDAKRWFDVFTKAANSSQGKFVMVAPPGIENRATPYPGGP